MVFLCRIGAHRYHIALIDVTPVTIELGNRIFTNAVEQEKVYSYCIDKEG